MEYISCKRCHATCTVRKARPTRIGDIAEHAEIITHRDGTKERRVYGHVNVVTNQIVDMTLL